MSRVKPLAEDYLEVFALYSENLAELYRETDATRYRLLFEQVVRLLARPSPFNLTLPEPFRNTALRYLEGHAATVHHMEDPTNRHFMLSDLYDYILLARSAARFIPRTGPAGRH